MCACAKGGMTNGMCAYHGECVRQGDSIGVACVCLPGLLCWCVCVPVEVRVAMQSCVCVLGGDLVPA